MTYRRFEELPAWQTARKLVRDVCRFAEKDDFRRNWGFRDQIQKAAISTMANIAEGFSRRSDREFVQFLFTAKASAAELQSHLYAALDLGYLDEATFRGYYNQADLLAKQLSGLISYLTGHRSRIVRG